MSREVTNDRLKRYCPIGREVLSQLQEDGLHGYLCGGTARDVLTEMIPNDIDIMVPGVKADAIRDCLRKMGPVSVINGMGTFELTMGETKVQITPAGCRKGSQGVDAMDDLMFRDFTMNAIALDLNGDLIDPFNGRADLANRCIRLVNGARTLKDSPIRVLRAYRFRATRNYTFEKQTEALLKEYAHLILEAPRDMWGSEMTKILTSVGARKALRAMSEDRVLYYMIPEMVPMQNTDQPSRWHAYDVFGHTLNVVSTISFTPFLRWAAFLHDVGKPATATRDEGTGENHFYHHDRMGSFMAYEIIHRFKLGEEMARKVSLLVNNHLRLVHYDPTWSDNSVLKLDRTLGAEITDCLAALAAADIAGAEGPDTKEGMERLTHFKDRLRELRKGRPPETRLLPPNIGGHVIKVLGISPGPEVGRVIHALEERVREGTLAEGLPIEAYDDAVREAYDNTDHAGHYRSHREGKDLPGTGEPGT